MVRFTIGHSSCPLRFRIGPEAPCSENGHATGRGKQGDDEKGVIHASDEYMNPPRRRLPWYMAPRPGLLHLMEALPREIMERMTIILLRDKHSRHRVGTRLRAASRAWRALVKTSTLQICGDCDQPSGSMARTCTRCDTLLCGGTCATLLLCCNSASDDAETSCAECATNERCVCCKQSLCEVCSPEWSMCSGCRDREL